MQEDHQIIAQVYAAKTDLQKADDLIRAYIPFIKKETSRFLSRICTDQDDEFSISLMSFHEAIQSYDKKKGAFLSYAALAIRSRLIDYQRKEVRHQGHFSLDGESQETEIPLHERLPDHTDHYKESAGLEATQQEIAELCAIMASFSVSLADVAENSPKQARTLKACSRVVQYAAAHPELLDELLHTKKLPISKLAAGSGVEKKTLERHRKYILAMLLIQTNGYEIIRGHIRHVLDMKGGVSA